MGRAAAELMFGMIDRSSNREEVSDIVLVPKLVVRESTAAPGASVDRDQAASSRGSWDAASTQTG